MHSEQPRLTRPQRALWRCPWGSSALERGPWRSTASRGRQSTASEWARWAPQSHCPAGSGLWVLASGKAQAHSGSCFGAARGKSLRWAQTAAVSRWYSSLDAARVVGSAEPSTCPIKPPGVELNGQQRAWLFRTLCSVIESSQPQRLDLGSAPPGTH